MMSAQSDGMHTIDLLAKKPDRIGADGGIELVEKRNREPFANGRIDDA
jgi:hypothetical protein